MLKDTFNCDFTSLLAIVNQSNEITRAKKQNRFITNQIYPLTKSFLQNYYLNSSFASYKKTFNDVNCAAKVYSYFLATYGYSSEGEAQKAGAAFQTNSSGLGLLGLFDLDLGFNLGDLLKNYWWILALIGVGYYIKEK